MERRTLLGRLSWQLVEVVATQAETAQARSITVARMDGLCPPHRYRDAARGGLASRPTHVDVYLCGPTPFVETAATSFVALRHEPARVKIERFGPTGEA